MKNYYMKKWTDGIRTHDANYSTENMISVRKMDSESLTSLPLTKLHSIQERASTWRNERKMILVDLDSNKTW